MTRYPSMFAWMSPRSHIQVRRQIRATFRGTRPTRGSCSAVSKSCVAKAASTRATRAPWRR